MMDAEALGHRLRAHGLATSRFGRALRHLDACCSTNDEAGAWAREGAPEGATVVTEAQTEGRGRAGREWFSPPGENLCFSLVLRPPTAAHGVAPLTLAAGVGVYQAVSALGLRPDLKWPNDVLLGGRKVCGILCEMSTEQDRVRAVILGVGVNVNTPEFPFALEGRATSLRRERRGEPLDRAMVLALLLTHLEQWYDRFLAEGPKGAAAAFRVRSRLLGQKVRLHRGDRVVEGLARDVDDEGTLLFEAGGRIERVLSGEVLLWD
jgi:BirA family transcriptional regulator, biotin operon repressor / biotin---[acetyl-CoA-carboxylase] ligase